jgi:general secretion pathway protein J
MRRPDVTSGDAGFTLVEALLATVLMGIIMAGLAAVTAQWMPSWDRGIGRLQRVEILALGLDRVVADIAAAKIISTGDGKGPPLFDGGELSVTFVRTRLNPNASGGLEIVRLAEVADERGPVLVRSTAPFVPTADAASADAILFSNPVTMVRAPYRVAFSYAGPDRVWRDTWHQQTVLPRAVRVQLRDLATSATLAVSTTALIHAELPASCTWPTAVTRCPGLLGPGTAAADLNGPPMQTP